MKKAIFILMICLTMILTACSIKFNFEPPTTTTTVPATIATTTALPTTTATTTAAPTTTVAPTTVETSLGNVLYGSFAGIEWGDYLHINITGDDGIDYSFFVIKQIDVDFETIENGTKVKVTWINSDEFLNPPGETVNIDQIIAFEIIK